MEGHPSGSVSIKGGRRRESVGGKKRYGGSSHGARVKSARGEIGGIMVAEEKRSPKGEKRRSMRHEGCS